MNWALQNPWHLFWGLAAFVPLILYLLRRRSAEKVEWAAMQFLQSRNNSPSPNPGWRKILLLATRVMLPILVAIAAATPACQSTNEANRTDSKIEHYIFVFDISASMGRTSNGNDSLQESKKKAVEIIQNAEIGIRFSILVGGAGESPSTVIETDDDAKVALESVKGLKSAWGRFPVEKIPAAIARTIRGEVARNLRGVEVVVLSDFQFGDWGEQINGNWLADINFLSDLNGAQDIRFRFVDCPSITNMPYVDKIQLIPAVAIAGSQTQCVVHVSGPEPDNSASNNLLVTLMANGNIIGEREVGEQSKARFTFTPDLEGVYELEAKLTNRSQLQDRIADTSRYATLPVKNAVNLLCVESIDNASMSLVAATEPIEGSAVPRINTSVCNIQELGSADLSSIDVIALIDVGECSHEVITTLRQFLGTGKSLFLDPGPHTQPGLVEKTLQQLSDATIGKFETSLEGEFRLNPLGYQHAVTSIFRGHPNAGLTNVPINRFLPFQVESGESESTQLANILEFNNGSPALVHLKLPVGQIAFSTTPFHLTSGIDAWNSLPAWWSYVPLTNQLFSWLAQSNLIAKDSLVGQAGQFPVDLPDAFDSVSVQLPDGQSQQIVLQTDGSQRIAEITFAQPGFARLATQQNHASQYSVAVNSSEHHDSESIDMVSLRSHFANLEDRTKPADSVLNVENKPTSSRNAYFICLTGLLALLVIEPMLANKKRRSQFHGGRTDGST